MNSNRFLGIFIAVTVLAWILVFALSPQPKYQNNISINIPKLPEPSIDQEQLQKIEFNEVKNNFLEIDTKDTLPSAKEKVDKIDFTDINVTYNPFDANWYVGFWVKNISDDRSLQGIYKASNLQGGSKFANYNDPRTMGISFGMTF